MDLDHSDNLAAVEKARLAVYACYRLVLLNVQLILTTDLPVDLFTEMKTEAEFDAFKNLIIQLHENKIGDFSVLLPYITKFSADK